MINIFAEYIKEYQPKGNLNQRVNIITQMFHAIQ